MVRTSRHQISKHINLENTTRQLDLIDIIEHFNQQKKNTHFQVRVDLCLTVKQALAISKQSHAKHGF